jgi:hypothetical protein
VVRSSRGLGAHFVVVARHPSLWLEASRMLAEVRARRALTPSTAYLGWRATTAYGSPIPIPGDELIEFLHWRSGMRALRRRGSGR